MCLYAIYLLAQTGAKSQEETTMNRIPVGVPVPVAGGGIGGLAAALALTRQGFAVKVLEQAPQLGEIGAGIRSARTPSRPSTPWASARRPARAVYTDEMVMHDALGHAAGCGLINHRPSEWQ
jgi:choline dehydrogenase-like flavoprotein